MRCTPTHCSNIGATKGVDHVGQRSANESVIARGAHLGSDIEIVAAKEDVLVINPKGRV
jgi:hypothetical protein